jgi:hypothetical protein
VSLVGTHHGPEDALGHGFGTPLHGPAGHDSLGGLDQNDLPGLAAKLP